MVCLDTIISDIITEIEIENTVILTDKTTTHKFVIDLNYFRHHQKLKNARIFRMILGFQQGLWKKPEYDKKKYKKEAILVIPLHRDKKQNLIKNVN